jgi:hypothetical protein
VPSVPQPAQSTNGIEWTDASLGAGTTLGLPLLALGGTLTVARRRHCSLARRPA